MMLEDSRFSKSSKSKHQPENHWNQGVRITRSKGSTGLVGARCSTELGWHVRRAERGRCSWSCCLQKTPTQSLFCTWISCKNAHSHDDPSVTPHQIPFGYNFGYKYPLLVWHVRRAERKRAGLQTRRPEKVPKENHIKFPIWFYIHWVSRHSRRAERGRCLQKGSPTWWPICNQPPKGTVSNSLWIYRLNWWVSWHVW